MFLCLTRVLTERGGAPGLHRPRQPPAIGQDDTHHEEQGQGGQLEQ